MIKQERIKQIIETYEPQMASEIIHGFIRIGNTPINIQNETLKREAELDKELIKKLSKL